MRFVAVLLLAVAFGGCGSAAPASSSPPPQGAEPTAPSSPPTSPTSSPSGDPASAIIGTWTRMQSCEDQLAAFTDAAFLDKAQEWVTGNWVGEQASATGGQFCEGTAAPREHSHFFTADGSFGSLDEHGSQVDDGHYVLKGPGTIQFPDSGVEVGYTVSGDTASFAVTVPDPCTDACRQTYAWALSAFYGTDPWLRQADQ